ncbi:MULTISPECIES: hypothetical protein [unclassified Microcoleus]
MNPTYPVGAADCGFFGGRSLSTLARVVTLSTAKTGCISMKANTSN